MKRIICLLAGCIGMAAPALFGAGAPSGSLMEIHSCELYAGGCVVSSEEPGEGRYMLRVWDFTGGDINGTEVKNLKLAVLQLSPDNLAEPKSRSGDAVVYLPQNATQAQRDAMLGWLKSAQPDFHPASLQTRTVALEFTKSGEGYSFAAGEFVSVKTASLKSCPTGGCGESLWYEPRAVAGPFTVAVNNTTRINEPLLKLKWDQGNGRNIFLARFGGDKPSAKSYVSLPELCGATVTLF